MISNKAGIKELQIFDNFQIDTNLPKYKNTDKQNLKVGFGVNGGDNNTVILSMPSSYNYGFNEKISIRQKLANWISDKNKAKVEIPKVTMSIFEFFTNLSSSFKEISNISDIALHYEKALKQANDLGQISLVEKIKDLIDVSRAEAYLIEMKLKKYVTEKQIMDFYNKVGEDKNLKLTWIKNFSRIIPEYIYEMKTSLDKKEIFDNYVILHYDPQNNGEEMTKAEIEKKKDPILFGVLKNSRKLYYIADWKDEYCQLTLEEMFNELQTDVLTINNKTVKSYLDLIK